MVYQQLFQLEAELLKALANSKRLEIIQLLEHGPLTVSEMVEMLAIRQSNLSQHLTQLRQQGVVTFRRSGTSIEYELSNAQISNGLKTLRSFLNKHHRIDDDIQNVIDSGVYPIVTDPVCGMRISRSKAADNTSYKSSTYYFCATGCRQKFDADPAKYIGAA